MSHEKARQSYSERFETHQIVNRQLPVAVDTDVAQAFVICLVDDSMVSF